jgi:hypothetical protein
MLTVCPPPCQIKKSKLATVVNKQIQSSKKRKVVIHWVQGLEMCVPFQAEQTWENTAFLGKTLFTMLLLINTDMSVAVLW